MHQVDDGGHYKLENEDKGGRTGKDHGKDKDRDVQVETPRSRDRSERAFKSRDKSLHERDRSTPDLKALSHSKEKKERGKSKGRDKDKDRDEDKERDREKERDKEREKDKEKAKSKDKDKHKHKDKEKDKERRDSSARDVADEKAKEANEKHKEKEKSSKSKDKDKDKDKHKDKDKDKDKDRDGREEGRRSRAGSFSRQGSSVMKVEEKTSKSKDKEEKEEDEKEEGKSKSGSLLKKKSSLTRTEARKERKKALGYKVLNSSSPLTPSKSGMLTNIMAGSSPSSSPPSSPSPSPSSSPSLPLTIAPPRAIPPRLVEPMSIAAVSRKPSSSRLDFEMMNAARRDISSDALLKSFSITQNAPFTKHLRADAPIFIKAFGLWKDLSTNPTGEFRARSYSSFSAKDLPISDFAIRTVAAIEAPPTQQEQQAAIADFEDWITSWVTKSTLKYLSDNLAINEPILKWISSGNLSTLSLRELPVIRATLAKFNTYFADFETSEYSKCLTQSVSEQVTIAAGLEGMNNKKMGPVRVSATYSKLPLQLIEVYRKSCEVALEELRMKEIERYIDGTAKEKLSSWWLTVIQERVDHFLAEIGYDFMTVPQDYTLTPPRSIRKVRGNLNLINKCLVVPTEDESATNGEGSASRPASPDRPSSLEIDRPVTPLERPTTPLSSRSTERSASRTGTWGRNSKMRPAVSEQSISMERPLSPGSIVRNHRESLLSLVDELSEQIYGVIEEFIEEALIVLEDGLIQYMEENDVKTEYDSKILNKGDREILELDTAEKILRKCIIADLAKSESVDKPLEHEESKFLLRFRNKETEYLSNLNNLAKDIRYLYRMMELEDESKVTARLMDAVPVTGLILARMCTLENETRTVLELWEERAKEEAQPTETTQSAGHYTGYKKFKEGGGEGNILRILNEGANMQRHGKRRILTTATHVHVPTTLDFVVFSTTDAAHSRVTKQIPIMNLKSVELGKTPTFCFHAVDSCCFYIPLNKGNTLNLETKTPLERDKWVAALKWLLATRDTRSATSAT